MKRRFLASLLALGMLLSLLSGAAFAAGEDGSGTGPAEVGTFAELQTAVVNDGANIVLTSDISIEEDITFGEINMDLAGHSIIVPEGKTLTINGGEFTSNGFNLFVIQGTAAINSGTFESTLKASANNGDSKSIIQVNGQGAVLNMKGGTIDASETGDKKDCGMYGLSLFNGAEVTLGTDGSETGPTINGSFSAIGMNFTQANPKMGLTIYGGTYTISDAIQSEQFNAVLYLSAAAGVKIKGGTFTATDQAGADGNPYIISLPYSNSGTTLEIEGGSFSASSSTVFRTKAPSEPGGGAGDTKITIKGGKFAETKPGDKFSFEDFLGDGFKVDDNGNIVEDSGPTIEDLTVTATRDEDDEDKIKLTVTGDAAEGSTRYYCLYESAPDVPDPFVESEWKALTDESIPVTDAQKYVAVAEVKDGKITHWGKASIPGKGGDSTDPGDPDDPDDPDNPDKPDIKSLTVTAKRDTDNKVSLTVTETAAAGSTRYYRLYESDPVKPTGDGFTASEWTAFPAGSITVTDSQKYVAVAEVKDGKITHWGKQSIPAKTDTPTGPDKPTDPVLPADRYWISSYSNSRGTVSTTSWADAGDRVWVRLYPRSGYYADGLTATDRWGDRLDVYYEGNDWYTFTMPASNVWLDPIFISNYVYTPAYNTYTPPVNNTPTVPENNNRPSYNSGTVYYRDVPANAWYYSAVQYAYRYNLMSGTSNGVFSPNQTTNRAMVVTMLYNMAGRPSVSGGRFDDVASDAWYADAVVWAAKNGITSGYGGFFRPGEAVTREQMALMLYNYAKLQSCDVSAQSGLSGFRDTARITPQAQKAVSWANAEGLLNGVSGGRLDPKGLVTRAQIASILMNFRENVM
jgi:hypothetical protein